MGCCRDHAKKVVSSLARRGLHEEALVVAHLTLGAEWTSLPRGWTEESVKKFWSSLTGDREHKIQACIKKMTGKVEDPGAFCGGLASRVGYR